MATITTRVPTQSHHLRTALIALAAAAVVFVAAASIWTVVDSDGGTAPATTSISETVLTPAEEVQLMSEASAGSPVQLSPAEEVQLMRRATSSIAPQMSVMEEIALLRANG